MYPKFFPSAKSIKQGLYLFLLNIPFLFFLLLITIVYHFLDQSAQAQADIIINIFSVFLLIFGGLILGYIDYLFFGDHKSPRQNLTFLPPNKSIVEGHLLILFSIFSYLMQVTYAFVLKKVFLEHDLMIEGMGFIVWIITACYCFYLRQIIIKV